MTNRNEIRSAILNAKNTGGRSKQIEFFGQTIEIRSPTLGQLSRMLEDDKTPTIVGLLVEYCYVPGTKDEKVFEQADRDELLKLPTGDWLGQFNRAVEELTGVDVEVAEKN